MTDNPGMARIEFGSLREAWRGEAVDFTPLLAQQLDQIGDEIGVDLLGMGQAEVATAGAGASTSSPRRPTGRRSWSRTSTAGRTTTT